MLFTPQGGFVYTPFLTVIYNQTGSARCVTVSFFSLQFNHAFTGSITVSFSVCSVIMLSQVALQFLIQLAFDHALSGCIRVSFV